MSKKSNNLQQLKVNLMFIGVLIALFMTIFIFLIKDLNEDLKNLLINCISSILTGVFVVFIWDKLTHEIRETEKEYVIKEINKALQGLRLLDVEKAFDKAASYLSECSEIRVIGTTKQNHHQGPIKTSIDSYLTATIHRLKREDRIKYRRITSKSIETSFEQHLKDCFDGNRSRTHDIELMMIEDFVPAFTYLILDDTFLMVSLNYPNQSPAAKNHYCFFTEDFDIITRFISHFKAVWEEESKFYRRITKTEEFEHELYMQEKLNWGLSKIKTSINGLPSSNRLYTPHVIEEVNQTAERLLGIAQGKLEIDHTMANGNMTVLFCIYFSALNEGDSYHTITFAKFWKNFFDSKGELKLFLKKNKEAIERGVKVTRTLVIPSYIGEAITSGEINEEVELYLSVIEVNLKMKKDITPKFRDNYDFRIYFSDSHNDLEKEFYNFALINSKTPGDHQAILFSPSNKEPIGDTNINIYDEKLPKEKYPRHTTKVEISQDKIDEIKSEWISQGQHKSISMLAKQIQFEVEIVKELFYSKDRVTLDNSKQKNIEDNSSFE